MADLLGFLPQLGSRLFGAPPVADQDPPLFQPTDRTTIAGMPIAPLVTGGLAALLFNRLARKGYGRQAALQGFGIGHGLMNAPILQEQKQQDALVQSGLESGIFQPAQAPSPVPLAGPTQLGQAPLIGTPTGAPSFGYGGMRLQVAPKVSLADLFPGVKFSPQVAATQVPANQAAQLAYPAAQQQRTREWLTSQGMDPNIPLPIAENRINTDYKISQAQKLAAALGAPAPNETVQRVVTDEGVKEIRTMQSQADIDFRKQQEARQAAAEEWEQGYQGVG